MKRLLILGAGTAGTMIANRLVHELNHDWKITLVDADETRERIASIYGERTFAGARIPLHIVATDFMTGEPVILSQGRVMDAIRASIAIPMIFAPYEVEGRLLMDGAVSNPLPVDVAIKEGCDIILAMGFELLIEYLLYVHLL